MNGQHMQPMRKQSILRLKNLLIVIYFFSKYRPFRFQQSSTVPAPTGYIDLDNMNDEEMPLANTRSNVALQGTSRISNIRSRLDNMPQQESHGIFSQPKTKVLVPAGHRIVVSNLQSTVTQDDIKVSL